MRPFHILPVAAVLSAIGCTDSHPAGTIEIARLDHAIEAATVADADTAAFDAWLHVTSGAPVTGNRDSLCRDLAASAAYRVFAPDVDNLLPDLDNAIPVPDGLDGFPARIYGVISPYRQSVVTVDTLLFVALNHYLGADYAGYSAFPDYQRRLKTVSQMPVDITEAWLRSRYPFPDSIAAPTLLQRMTYEGAIAAAIADCLDMNDDSAVMGWTAEEWTDAVTHEAVIWDRIVGGEMLYSDDPALLSRLIDPAPASPDISPDAPGRIGRFTGLRMVRAASGSPIEILAGKTYLSSDILRTYPQAIASSRSMTTPR